MNQSNPSTSVHTSVRQHYGDIASRAVTSTPCSCGCSQTETENLLFESAVSKNLYQDENVSDLPSEVTNLSLGCGDPITLAGLQPGQTVLDLGSGGGIDCFLAARRVGNSGFVIGVDMTAEMLEKARANKDKLKAENVDFRLGEIEHLPVADTTVDVVISNCVINLSPDKDQVFKETFRVLKPGGKLAVSDIVSEGPLPEKVKIDMTSWAECISGALDVKDYLSAIQNAGFIDIKLERTDIPPEYFHNASHNSDEEKKSGEELALPVFSAKITAVKPQI